MSQGITGRLNASVSLDITGAGGSTPYESSSFVVDRDLAHHNYQESNESWYQSGSYSNGSWHLGSVTYNEFSLASSTSLETINTTDKSTETNGWGAVSNMSMTSLETTSKTGVESSTHTGQGYYSAGEYSFDTVTYNSYESNAYVERGLGTGLTTVTANNSTTVTDSRSSFHNFGNSGESTSWTGERSTVVLSRPVYLTTSVDTEVDSRLSIGDRTRQVWSYDTRDEHGWGSITSTGSMVSMTAMFTQDVHSTECLTLYQHGSYTNAGGQSLDSHLLDYDLHARETYSEAGSGYTVMLASTEGGGGGIGGGLDPNSLITRTYSYTELNTMTLDEMRNESGTFSAGNYNFGSYSYSNVDKSLESRSESGTRATSMGTEKAMETSPAMFPFFGSSMVL